MSALPNPLEQVELKIELELRGELAKQLLEYAERFKREPAALLSDLIERVLLDDLVDAVLDEHDD